MSCSARMPRACCSRAGALLRKPLGRSLPAGDTHRKRPPRRCAFRPSMDEKSVRAGRACRRATPGATARGRNPLRSRFARVRFAPPCGSDRPARTAAQGPRKSFASTTAIVASLEARANNRLRTSTRAGCAPVGAPRTRRADDGSVRRMARRLHRQDCRCERRRRPEGRATGMWRVMRASSPQAQGCAFGDPRRPLANPEHRDVLRTGSRGGLLFDDFLLAKQEKVTRAPGRGAEQDRDVAWHYARNQDRNVIPPMLRIDPLPSEGDIRARERLRTVVAP